MNSTYVPIVSLYSAAKGVLFRSLPERLIAFLRLIFSVFALVAIYIDPTNPATYVEEIYILFSLYVIYSAILTYVSSSINFRFPLQLIIHCTDIAALSVAVLLTDGLGSPFFTFYTFTLFTATMRWGWRGAFSTAAVLAVLFVAISWEDLEFRLSKDSQSNILIMRGLYLFVSAAMLGYLGAYMDRSRRRLARLAAWPLESGAVGSSSPLGALRHATNVLGARWVLVVWWDEATQLKRVAYWSKAASGFAELDTFAPWEDLVLNSQKAEFFPSGVAAREMWHAIDALVSPLDQEARPGPAKPRQRSFAFAPLQSRHFRGGVLIGDLSYHGEDIVSLGEIVAIRISADLERDLLTREVAEAAMVQERERVARDMHDSVLQDLTAASLILKSALAQIPPGPSAALKEVSWLLANQQRRIRTFVERTSLDAAPAPQSLEEQLDLLLRTLERQWKCRLNATVAPPGLRLPGSLSLHVFQLISEAIANAARHGQASEVAIAISASDQHVSIRIRDDGTGMPTGNKGAVVAKPRSIRKRVADLDGTLDLSSIPGHTQLSIRIPVHDCR